MGIWGHPDDEAYLSTGLMMRALSNGDRAVCVQAIGEDVYTELVREEFYREPRVGDERVLRGGAQVFGGAMTDIQISRNRLTDLREREIPVTQW